MSDEEEYDPVLVNISAQLRLIMSVLPTLVASLPEAQYRGTIEALESLTEGVRLPILAKEIDELRLKLALQCREIREGVEALQRGSSDTP